MGILTAAGWVVFGLPTIVLVTFLGGRLLGAKRGWVALAVAGFGVRARSDRRSGPGRPGSSLAPGGRRAGSDGRTLAREPTGPAAGGSGGAHCYDATPPSEVRAPIV